MERPRLAGARGKSPEGGILDRARERESPLAPSTKIASQVREAAECLSSQRTTTVAALEKELSVARLQYRDVASRLEKKMKDSAKAEAALRKELEASERRRLTSSEMARDWEKSWREERSTCEALQALVSQMERDLVREREEHSDVRRVRECLEMELQEENESHSATMRNLQEKYEQACRMQQRAEVEARRTSSELQALKSEMPELSGMLSQSKENLSEEKQRRMFLEEEVKRREEQALELEARLSESETLRIQQQTDTESRIGELTEINAQLCGHRNAKQKIQYLLKVKQDNEVLKSERRKLEALLNSLLSDANAPTMHARYAKAESALKKLSTSSTTELQLSMQTAESPASKAKDKATPTASPQRPLENMPCPSTPSTPLSEASTASPPSADTARTRKMRPGTAPPSSRPAAPFVSSSSSSSSSVPKKLLTQPKSPSLHAAMRSRKTYAAQ